MGPLLGEPSILVHKRYQIDGPVGSTEHNKERNTMRNPKPQDPKDVSRNTMCCLRGHDRRQYERGRGQGKHSAQSRNNSRNFLHPTRPSTTLQPHQPIDELLHRNLTMPFNIEQLKEARHFADLALQLSQHLS
eukprot:3506895-Amphidinium_carterae.1